MTLLPLLAVLAVAASVSEGAQVISLSQAKSELYIYRKRVEFLRKELLASCPDYILAEANLVKRADVDLYLHQASIRVEKETYNHLLNLLVKCRLFQLKTTSTKSPTKTTKRLRTTYRTTKFIPRKTTVKPRIKTTTPPPSTTSYNGPCASAETLNLTDVWRNSYKFTLPKATRHEDTKLLAKDIWFRFTGAAGTRLRDTCPLWYSCGSSSAYWSDAKMPSEVGETLKFHMYESWSKNGRSDECKIGGREFQATVIRCSHRYNDLVYKFDQPMSGGLDTVCGMN